MNGKIENPIHLLAHNIVEKVFPPDILIFRVKHPTNAQRVLDKTEVELPRSQANDEIAVKNALDSLEVPSVFS